MKKLMLCLLMGMFLISFASAYLPHQQNTNLNLIQNCNNCTYCNITKMETPSNLLRFNIQMEQDGTAHNYTFNNENFTELGNYCIYGVCGNPSESKVWNKCREVTPSGQNGSSNIVLILILIIIFYAIGFIGFFGKNEWVSILGGLGMMALGVYIIQEGLVIYRDFLTNAFSYITIGLGAIFSLVAIVEYIQETM